MRYLLAVAAIIAAIHGYHYGKWLMKNHSKGGAIIVYLLSFLLIILPLRELLFG